MERMDWEVIVSLFFWFQVFLLLGIDSRLKRFFGCLGTTRHLWFRPSISRRSGVPFLSTIVSTFEQRLETRGSGNKRDYHDGP